MTQKKIDTKKVVAGIFGRSKGVSGAVDDERVTSLLGGQKGKPGREKASARKESILFYPWKNEFGAIDVGNDSIKFALLSKERNRLVLKDLQVEKLIRSAGGRENQPERDREVISGLVKIASRVKPQTKVGISLNDPFLYMDSLTLAVTGKEDLGSLVRTELSEKHLIDSEASFFDFVVGNAADESHFKEVFVVAAPKDLVHRQLEMVQSVGFKVLAVETNALTSLQAIQRVSRWSGRERVLILDIGHRFTNLTLMIGERVVFGRIIPIAGERFTKAIQQAANFDFEQAEQLKFKYGIKSETQLSAQDSSGKMVPPELRQEASEAEITSRAVGQEVEKLLVEIERSFQFAFAKEGGSEGVPIHSIFLLGGGARLPGLKEMLESRWGASLRPLALWEGLVINEKNIDPGFLNEAADLAVVSLGLALRVREWNTLPFGWGMPR